MSSSGCSTKRPSSAALAPTKLRLVVTGAKGFVGSILSLRAVERGHSVLALDNESRGLNPIGAKIGDSYQKFDCMQGIAEAVKTRGWDRIDAVVHLAAATGSLERPLDELLEFNVGMTQHVYTDALALGAKTFLWPTTSLALGVPDSPYVESKEQALRWLLQVDKQARISQPVRFFNMTGAYKGLTERRLNEVHILPVMLQKYQAREQFVVNGGDYATVDGSPSRDFTNIVDAVDTLLDIAENRARGKVDQPRAKDEAVWLGTGQSTTVLELIKMFDQWVGALDYKIGPRRAFDCGSLIVEPTQASQFKAMRGGLVPVRISVRDELMALMEDPAAVAAEEPVTETVLNRVVETD